MKFGLHIQYILYDCFVSAMNVIRHIFTILKNVPTNTKNVMEDVTSNSVSTKSDLDIFDDNTEVNPLMETLNTEAIQSTTKTDENPTCNEINREDEMIITHLNEFEKVFDNVKKYEEAKAMNNDNNVLPNANSSEPFNNLTVAPNNEELHRKGLEIDLDEVLDIIDESEETKLCIQRLDFLKAKLAKPENEFTKGQIPLNNKNTHIPKTLGKTIDNHENTEHTIENKNVDVISISSTEELEISQKTDFDVITLSSMNSVEMINEIDMIQVNSKTMAETSNCINGNRKSLNVAYNNTYEKYKDKVQSEYLHNHKEFKNQFVDVDPRNSDDTLYLPNDISKEENGELSDNLDCSFHSSDFEFITEEEAKEVGFIINFRRPTENVDDSTISDHIIEPSHIINDEMKSHVIPVGENFLTLFQGPYAPALLSSIYFMENKSVQPSKTMSVEFEGIGFDMRILNEKIREDNSEEECEWQL